MSGIKANTEIADSGMFDNPGFPINPAFYEDKEINEILRRRGGGPPLAHQHARVPAYAPTVDASGGYYLPRSSVHSSHNCVYTESGNTLIHQNAYFSASSNGGVYAPIPSTDSLMPISVQNYLSAQSTVTNNRLTCESAPVAAPSGLPLPHPHHPLQYPRSYLPSPNLPSPNLPSPNSLSSVGVPRCFSSLSHLSVTHTVAAPEKRIENLENAVQQPDFVVCEPQVRKIDKDMLAKTVDLVRARCKKASEKNYEKVEEKVNKKGNGKLTNTVSEKENSEPCRSLDLSKSTLACPTVCPNPSSLSVSPSPSSQTLQRVKVLPPMLPEVSSSQEKDLLNCNVSPIVQNMNLIECDEDVVITDFVEGSVQKCRKCQKRKRKFYIPKITDTILISNEDADSDTEERSAKVPKWPSAGPAEDRDSGLANIKITQVYSQGVSVPLSEVESTTSSMESKCSSVESRFSNVESKSYNVESKSSNVESKLSNVESKSSNVESKSSNVESKFSIKKKPTARKSTAMNDSTRRLTKYRFTIVSSSQASSNGPTIDNGSGGPISPIDGGLRKGSGGSIAKLETELLLDMLKEDFHVCPCGVVLDKEKQGYLLAKHDHVLPNCPKCSKPLRTWMLHHVNLQAHTGCC